MNAVTKSIVIPDVPSFAYKALNGENGPLTNQNLLLLSFGAVGASRQNKECTGMIYEVTGPDEVVEAALATAQKKVPEFVNLLCVEAIAEAIMATLLSRTPA